METKKPNSCNVLIDEQSNRKVIIENALLLLILYLFYQGHLPVPLPCYDLFPIIKIQ